MINRKNKSVELKKIKMKTSTTSRSLISLFCSFLVLSVGLVASALRANAESLITLSTAKAAGETVKIRIVGEAPITMEGVKEEPVVNQKGLAVYTLTAGNIVIHGKVTELYCYTNSISGLTLKGTDALQLLDCTTNQITSLDLTEAPNLQKLFCYDNRISSLILPNQGKLTELWASTNQLSAIDLSHVPMLEELWCSENLISSLDLSKVPNLKFLYCHQNAITKLDLSVVPELLQLYCHKNKLSTLDLSGLKKLIWLDCSSNNLTSLSIEPTPVLEKLICADNKLTTFDLTPAKSLQEFHCNGNLFSSLDLSPARNLFWLQCYGNTIKGEKMTAMIESLVNRMNSRGGAVIAVKAIPSEPDNVCLTTDVTKANNKNWYIYNSDKKPYDGAPVFAALHQSKRLLFYPNPAKDYLTIQGAEPNTVVSLYTPNGRLCVRTNTNEAGEAYLSLTAYDAGNYLLRIGTSVQVLMIAR